MMNNPQISVRPKPEVCPKIYCFFWAEQGDFVANGMYANLEKALAQLEEVKESGCNCSLGLCCRDERLQKLNPSSDLQSLMDFYEPCEPELDKAGIPHDYFSIKKK